MDSLIFQDLDQLSRIRILESNAADIVDGFSYDRVLNEEDVADEQAKFSNLHIEMVRIEAEKAAAVALWNAELKKRRTLAEQSLQLIKTKRQEVLETVYVIRDEVENKVGTYNMHGELITERPMRKTERGERQYRMNLNSGDVAEFSDAKAS